MTKTTKYFTRFILIMIGSVVLFLIIGKVQNGKFDDDFNKLNEARSQLDQNPGLSENLLIELNSKYPDNYYIHQVLAESFAIQKNYKQASFILQKAVDEQPLLITNSIFDLNYGQIALFNGEKEKAKLLIYKAKEIGVEAQYQALLESLLKKVNS